MFVQFVMWRTLVFITSCMHGMVLHKGKLKFIQVPFLFSMQYHIYMQTQGLKKTMKVLLGEGVHSIPIQLSNLAQHDCAYCSGIKTSVLNKVCFQNVIL